MWGYHAFPSRARAELVLLLIFDPTNAGQRTLAEAVARERGVDVGEGDAAVRVGVGALEDALETLRRQTPPLLQLDILSAVSS